MRFPYQRSVGRDLQALFQYERLRASTDTLGQSSIDEGSGALEVRDGAGTAVAIGDLPGGGVGIGIRWQGNLTDLAAVLQDLADEIASGGGGGNNDLWDSRQDRDIAGLRRRSANNENTDTLQDQGIGKLGKRADTKDTEVAELRARVKALEERAVEHAGGIAKVGQQAEQTTKGLGEVRQRATKNSSDLGKTRQKGDILEVMYEEARREQRKDRGLVESLREWFDDLLEGDLQSLADTAWRNQHEVTQARGGKQTLGKRVDGIDKTAQGAATAAANAQSTADAAGSAAAAAQSTANGAATAAASAQSSANQANDRITDARGSYGSLTSRLNAMDSATGTAQARADAAWDRAGTALSNAATAQAGVNQIANSVIPQLVTAINNLRSRVAALDGGPGGPIVIP